MFLRRGPLYFMITIHAPREGGDPSNDSPEQAEKLFQSTPPARGATSRPGNTTYDNKDFNPRPPRGGRHSLPKKHLHKIKFQSTPPARGATAKMHSFICESLINK